MLTKNINFKNFKVKSKNLKIINDLKLLLKEDLAVINSLKLNYKYNYNKNVIKKFKKKTQLRIIGMGGSILGMKAIYSFLKKKVKQNIVFIDNLKSNLEQDKKKKFLNLIISKSGNTLETITNANILIGKNDENIFITGDGNSYLKNLANELKAEIITHNNYIGGRYSVLSEVGMLPSELIGLDEKKFKQLNSLIKNKKFIHNLTFNVSNTLQLINKKKFNSIILNYDENSNDFLLWYQQLLGESLGKKSKGIFPIISSMPKDNHSLMQLYLDGPKKNFFTFFNVFNKFSPKIYNKKIFSTHEYLKNKNIDDIIYSQKTATEKVFAQKKIPFRSFEIKNTDEKTLGELFSFFILETILLGRALKVNPFDQPSVELVKQETKKILI